MQITLKQTELEVAVRDYIENMGINHVGEISFSATRGAEGITTTVEVGKKTKSSNNKTGQLSAVAAPAPETVEETDEETIDTPFVVVAPDVPEGKSLFG